MSNPDTTGANIGGISTLGGFIVIIVIILFNYHKSSYFNALLYGGLPLLIYILMFFVLYISKKKTNVKNALLSAVPTIGTTYLALFISYISYFRLPVASVFAPFFLDSVADIIPHSASDKIPDKIPDKIQNSLTPLSQYTHGGYKKKKQAGGACCSPTYSLNNVEAQFPIIKGISYGFYLFFAICFGGVFGSSMPSV
jgi:hypothetical protein